MCLDNNAIGIFCRVTNTVPGKSFIFHTTSFLYFMTSPLTCIFKNKIKNLLTDLGKISLEFEIFELL